MVPTRPLLPLHEEREDRKSERKKKNKTTPNLRDSNSCGMKVREKIRTCVDVRVR
jgi:hypothetical protein